MQNTAVTSKAPKFQGQNLFRDKSKNIFYFNNVKVGGEGSGTLPATMVPQPYSHRTYYVDACFPIVMRDVVGT